MLVERQIAERQVRASAAIAKILERPDGEPDGDYRVKSASGKTYRVAMRGPGLFENYCSCPDFAVNTLGTCKHIEALLLRLRKRYGRRFESKEYARTRASISLLYAERIDIRLRLPAAPSLALRKLAEEYFDPAGLLRQEFFLSFHQVIEAFRKADRGWDTLTVPDRLADVDVWDRGTGAGLLGRARRPSFQSDPRIPQLGP
jgi:hypothetical protein